jgi:hypothetical protein
MEWAIKIGKNNEEEVPILDNFGWMNEWAQIDGNFGTFSPSNNYEESDKSFAFFYDALFLFFWGNSSKNYILN